MRHNRIAITVEYGCVSLHMRFFSQNFGTIKRILPGSSSRSHREGPGTEVEYTQHQPLCRSETRSFGEREFNNTWDSPSNAYNLIYAYILKIGINRVTFLLIKNSHPMIYSVIYNVYKLYFDCNNNLGFIQYNIKTSFTRYRIRMVTTSY